MLAQLIEAGLSDKEAKTYLAVLELAHPTILEISKKSRLNRATTYNIVKSLIENGLLHHTKRGSKSIYIAADPKKIIALLRQKEAAFTAILPQLQAIQNDSSRKPKVQFYEGKEEVLVAIKDCLTAENEILIFSSEVTLQNIQQFYPELFLERTLRGVHAKVIAPDIPKLRELETNTEKFLRVNKFIPAKYAFEFGMYIYNNKISIFSNVDDIAMIIESENMANSWRNIFFLIWDMVP